jgi:metal-responsive CopG/Arc/MetJ family transcriptional regulator
MGMITSNSSIRYTTVLPAKYVEELKQLAAKKVISSVNNGIREAIKHYLAESKREQYARQMADAVKDQGFMERTLDTQATFKHVDSEVGGQW